MILTRLASTRFLAAFLVSLVLVVGAGCSAGSSSAPDAGFTVNMDTQPTPMQSGRVATVTLRVAQPGGAAVTGAKVSFTPEHTSMSMGSGGPVATQEREPGVYSAEYLPAMSGTYRVTVNVEASQGRTQRVIDANVR
ncbi:MAG: FixH family protein [Chloroflexi bacterium]|nr:FixH family protein [Chloroflexota bacterium]